jgi:hypothetical protein
VTILRLGSNDKYASGWESAFGKPAKSATKAKTTTKASARKKTAKKKTAKKKTKK